MEQSTYDESMKQITDMLKGYKKKSLIIHLCDCGVLHWVSSKEIDINQTFVCTCGKKYDLKAMEKKEKITKNKKNTETKISKSLILESLIQPIDYAFRKILNNENFSIEVSDNYFKDVLSELIVWKFYSSEEAFFYNLTMYQLGLPATLVFDRYEYSVKRDKETVLFEFLKTLNADERELLKTKTIKIDLARKSNVKIVKPENFYDNVSKLNDFAILSVDKEEFNELFKNFLKSSSMTNIIYEKQSENVNILYSTGITKIIFGFSSFTVIYNDIVTVFKFNNIIDDEDYENLKSRDAKPKH